MNNKIELVRTSVRVDDSKAIVIFWPRPPCRLITMLGTNKEKRCWFHLRHQSLQPRVLAHWIPSVSLDCSASCVSRNKFLCIRVGGSNCSQSSMISPGSISLRNPGRRVQGFLKRLSGHGRIIPKTTILKQQVICLLLALF